MKGCRIAYIDLYYAKNKSAQGSIYSTNASLDLLNGNKSVIKAKVESVPLSKELINYEVDLVKIDVERAEKFVIEGSNGIKWKFMYVELFSNRCGKIELSDFMKLVNFYYSKARIIKYFFNKNIMDIYLTNMEFLQDENRYVTE